MLNPSTPGTIVVLVATVLLILATASTPVNKSIYFLQADLSAAVDQTSIHGTLTLGTFGYCITIGSTNTCSSTSLGYSINVESVFGVSSELASEVSGISNSVIKWLTYVLVLHPIAAGLAGAAFLSGLLSHIREYSRTCFTSCFTSMAASVAFLAFVFDIVVFSIAKSRINSSSVGGHATLGPAIWMTLGGGCLLAVSGCFFCAGRCLLRNRRSQQDAAEKMRPTGDLDYADKMRMDAEYAEKRRAEEANRRAGNRSNLPAFAEFGNEEMSHEAIPLTQMQYDDERYGYSDGRQAMHRSPSRDSAGHSPVVGYVQRNPSRTSMASHSRGMSTENQSQQGGSHFSNGQPYQQQQHQRRQAPPMPSVHHYGLVPGGGGRGPGMSPGGPRDPYDYLPPHVESSVPYMSPRLAPPMEEDRDAEEGQEGGGPGEGQDVSGDHGTPVMWMGNNYGHSYQDPYASPPTAPAPALPSKHEPYHSSAHYRYNPKPYQAGSPSRAAAVLPFPLPQSSNQNAPVARGYDESHPTWYPTYGNNNNNGSDRQPPKVPSSSQPQSPTRQTSHLAPPPPPHMRRAGGGDSMEQSGLSHGSSSGSYYHDQFQTAPQTPMAISYHSAHLSQLARSQTKQLDPTSIKTNATIVPSSTSPPTGSHPLPPLPSEYDKRNYPIAQPNQDESEHLPRYD